MVVLSVLLNILLVFLGFILIVLVLLQRGRGGGLAGAFGGMGGQSAFGTKAGDIFTRITVVVAVLWVLVAGLSGYVARSPNTQNAASRASGLRQGGDDDAKGAGKDGAAGAAGSTTDADKSGTAEGTESNDAASAGTSAGDAAKSETTPGTEGQATPPAETSKPVTPSDSDPTSKAPESDVKTPPGDTPPAPN